MNLPRRRFLHLAAGAAAITTLAQAPIPTPARGQAAPKSAVPKRPARDRLEEALARIADPKGEGARACLTVYTDAARAAANAADARARAGLFETRQKDFLDTTLGAIALVISGNIQRFQWRPFEPGPPRGR